MAVGAEDLHGWRESLFTKITPDTDAADALIAIAKKESFPSTATVDVIESEENFIALATTGAAATVGIETFATQLVVGFYSIDAVTGTKLFWG